MAPYTVLLVLFGIGPVGYAIAQSLARRVSLAGTETSGLGNYAAVYDDFRFGPAALHVALFLLVWLPLITVGVLGLALLLHSRPGRFSGGMRLVYFLPSAVTGSASVLLWLFVTEPEVSPFGPVLRAAGVSTSAELVNNDNLPAVFAVMAFTAGAGGWIVITYGALQNLDADVLEAAQLDGCNAWQTARHVKLPMISRYVTYMVVLNFAAGVQLFVEPDLLASLSPGQTVSSPWWSLNQLGYNFAFRQSDFAAAAASAVILLLVSLVGAVVIIRFTKLFRTDVPSA